jgi:uncharacterized protein
VDARHPRALATSSLVSYTAKASPNVRRQQYAESVIRGLVQIRQLGIAKEAENQEFRRYLSAHHHRIEPFRILAAQIQQQIDCTTCANCCRHSIVTVDEADIEAIAQHLKLDAKQVRGLYTLPDPDAPGGRILQSTQDGCIFLDRKLCLIYEARPKPCRDFPHISSARPSLGGRFSSLCRWASLCPIVYNALESYKQMVGYHLATREPPATKGSR